jgi:hypothetical protein
MDPPRGRPLLVVLALFAAIACRGPRHPSLQAAIPAAIAALPWDSAPAGAELLCTDAARCDTFLVDPRVVLLPAPAPAFFVPAARSLLLDLSTPPAADFSAIHRPVRFTDWGQCIARRSSPEWSRQRVACIALGIAAKDSARHHDTLQVAILALTPAQGLVWPRVRVTVVDRVWSGTMTSYAGQ